MKKILFMLLLFAFSFAVVSPVPTSPTPVEATSGLVITINTVTSWIAQLMIVMIVLAAIVYVVGSFFGAETRARARMWAQGMVASVAVALVLILVLYFFLPSSTNAGASPLYTTGFQNSIQTTLALLWGAAESILGLLVITLFVLGALVYMLGHLFGAETRAQATVWSTALVVGAMFASILYVLGISIIQPLAEKGLKTVAIPPTTTLSPYVMIISLAMTFLFTVILITYLVSKIFKVPEWEAYLSVELSNLLNSYLVIFFAVGFFIVGDAIAMSLSSPSATTYTSPPQAALFFLRNKAAPEVLEGLFDIFKIQACASILSTFARRMGEFVLTNVYKLFPGADTFVSISNVVGYGLVAIYGSVSAQVTLLAIAEATIKKFFLPAGLVLRFFPPTRDAGSFLIALSIGFYIIFPMSYLINDAVLTHELNVDKYETPTVLIGMVCGPLNWATFGYAFNPNNFIFGSKLMKTLGLGVIFNKIISEGAINGLLVMYQFMPILKTLSKLTLVAIFLPAFSIIITIAFINATTKFLIAKV